MARHRQSTLFSLLLSLLFTSFTSAIDLGKAFGGRKQEDKDAKPSATDAEIAIANAKKLVEDMHLHDAATGTVTKYQPGREKEPVTCNDIMAKALVVSNEEKAAIVEERDSVVKAAALLSDRIDELGRQLQAANDEIQKLKGEVEEAEANTETRLNEQAGESDERIRKMTEEAKSAKDKADNEMNDMKKLVAEAQQNAADAIKKEQDRSKLNMEKLQNSTDAKIESIKEDCYTQVKELEKDRILKVNACERRVKLAEDKAEEDLEKARAEAAATVEKSRLEADEKVDAANESIKAANNKALEEIKQAKEEAAAKIEESNKLAEEKFAAFLSDAEDKKQAILRKTESQIADMKQQMKFQSTKIEQEFEEQREKCMNDIRQAHKDAEFRVKHAHDKLDSAVAVAEARIKIERDEKEKARLMFEEGMKESMEKNKALIAEIEEMKSHKSDLHEEILHWKETHQSQGYCNVTLMRQHSEMFVGASHNYLRELVNKWSTAAQRKSEETMLFIEKEVIPSMQSSVKSGRARAAELYDEHLAEVVNKNVMPAYNQHVAPIVKKIEKETSAVYNEHIQPAYKQHVAPIVKTIEKEAAVAIEKSKKEAIKARSGAASLVKQSSSSAINFIEEKEVDNFLPSFILDALDKSSKDGEPAVDTLFKGLLILLVILSRRFIYRIIGSFFSLIWFFCPLRVFFRRRGVGDVGQDTASTNAKPAQENKINGTKPSETSTKASESKGAGKKSKK